MIYHLNLPTIFRTISNHGYGYHRRCWSVSGAREKANGGFAKLKIVEVPDDLNWDNISRYSSSPRVRTNNNNRQSISHSGRS